MELLTYDANTQSCFQKEFDFVQPLCLRSRSPVSHSQAGAATASRQFTCVSHFLLSLYGCTGSAYRHNLRTLQSRVSSIQKHRNKTAVRRAVWMGLSGALGRIKIGERRPTDRCARGCVIGVGRGRKRSGAHPVCARARPRGPHERISKPYTHGCGTHTNRR